MDEKAIEERRRRMAEAIKDVRDAQAAIRSAQDNLESKEADMLGPARRMLSELESRLMEISRQRFPLRMPTEPPPT